MKCEEILERMPDVAAGLTPATEQENKHLSTCDACAGKLAEFHQTMALLDEWKAPEPSPYFDTRLKARLREEMAKPQAGWLSMFRRPVLATALTMVLAVGIGVFLTQGGGSYNSGTDQPIAENVVPGEPGTAVSDLQALEKNHELYADFDLLDDLQVQQDVVANP